MYAIVEIAGQQFKVAKDQKVYVHRLQEEEGAKVTFDKVMLVEDGGNVTMRNSSTEPSTSDNVVSLFERAREIKAKKEEVEEDVSEEKTPVESFTDIMRRNAENKARMAKERSKSNQGVIRSHRLKR